MKLVLAALLAATPALAATQTLVADPAHSTAGFSVKHMMLTTVRGAFQKMSATVEWDKANPAKSSVELKIDAASIDTRVADRDKHLKSPDFFDVQKCPEITFHSTKIQKAHGQGNYKVTGDLTMHCQTHPVTLDVEFAGKGLKTPWGNEVYTAAATGELDRTKWGLVWNKALESGGVLVSDKVKLDVELEMSPAPAQQKKESQKEATKPEQAAAPAK